MVEARGRVSMAELTRELRAPGGLVKEWIYALVQKGTFTGYINWDEGILYSAEADRLGELGRCPGCGAELGLRGKGVVTCSHCGLEAFL